MVSIQDYINATKMNNGNTFIDFEDKAKSMKYNSILNSTSKSDTFEKKGDKDNLVGDKENPDNKIGKKKIVKIGAIIAGVALAMVAFLKRKQIGEFLSNLFHKKSPEPPVPPTDNISSKAKTPPAPFSKPNVNPNVDTAKPTDKTNKRWQENIKKIEKEIPKPKFGDNPTILEKQQYTSKVVEYINSTEDQDLIMQALDKIQQYGTPEDLEKINAYVWTRAKDPLVVKLSQTVGKIGGENADIQLLDYMRPLSELSCDTYAEVFKVATDLSISYGGFRQCQLYDEFLSHLNKIPTDKNGKFTKALTDMLISVGKKEYIPQLDKYLRNYNYINEFMNKGEKTPQVVLDVINKVRAGIEAKG